jgi:hypothetical protein
VKEAAVAAYTFCRGSAGSATSSMVRPKPIRVLSVEPPLDDGRCINLPRLDRHRAVSLFIAVLLIMFSTQSGYAQSGAFAAITGRVLDPMGASVPNATVTAKNVETGLTRTIKTTTDGLYRFEDLRPGVYEVSVESASFSKKEVSNVKLLVGDQLDVNFGLEVSGPTQSVVVTSEVPLIETTKTDISMVIDDKAVSVLPTTTSFNALGGIANDYQGLAASAPGVKFDYSGDSNDIVGPGAVNDRGVMVNVDGGNISDEVYSWRDALGASLEEVKEFQVLTNNYNAEYGQASNVILNVITKSGTNDFHGDFHAYFRGRNLGASNTFYNSGLAALSPESSGCPPSDYVNGVLTTVSGCPRAPFYKHEYGLTAGGPFVKNRLFWFVSYEQPHQGAPLTLTPFNNPVTVSQPTREVLWSAKVDANLTANNLLTLRYNVQRDDNENLLSQTGPNTDPSGLVSAVGHDNVLNVGLVTTVTAHVVNQARFFWHRSLTQTTTNSTLPAQKFSNGYTGADFCCPLGGVQNRYQYIDDVTWTHGTHTLKAGINISDFPYNSLFQQYHYGLYQGFSQVGGTATNPILRPGQFTVGLGTGFVEASDTIYGLYVQDTWRLRPTLTLNYGLRYDYENGALQGGTIQNSSVKGGCLQGNGLIPACSSDNNNFQPRLGIAWNPNFENGALHTLFGDDGKSVIRASGGVMTQMAILNVSLDSLTFDGLTLLTATAAATPSTCFNTNGGPNASTTDPNCTVLQAYPNAPTKAAIEAVAVGDNFGRVRPISNTIKNPNIYMAALVIDRQVGESFSFSVGYQGVFGNGLLGETDTNFPTPVADPEHPGYYYMPAAGRPNSSFDAIRTSFSNRTSSYNGLVLSTQKRLSHHYQFQANYTFSKTLASVDDWFGLSEPGNPLASLKLEKALAQQDIRNLVNLNVVADTNDISSQRYIKYVINNWTLGLLSTLQSGRPYPVSTGDGAFAGSSFVALGAETNQRPNVLPDGTIVTTDIASVSGTNVLLSQDAVAQCENPALQFAGQPGAPPTLPAAASNCSDIQTTFLAPAGRASANGPVDSYTGKPVDFKSINGDLVRNAGKTLPLYRFDLSVMRSLPIPHRESMRLQLKMDVFNLFNSPLYILNNGNDALAGIIRLPPTGFQTPVPGQPGQVSYSTNADFNCSSNCINPYSGFYVGANGAALNIKDFTSGRVDKSFSNPNFGGLGNPSGSVTPRVLQLAVRVIW